jgi:hypothetical protein
MKCPICDGAMVEKSGGKGYGRYVKYRCVRCGVPKPPKVPWSKLREAHAKIQTRGRSNEAIPRRYWGSIMVGNHELFVGYRGVLLRPPKGDDELFRSIDDTETLVPIDIKRPLTDKAYWGAVRAGVFGLLPNNSECGQLLWKRIKEFRMREQSKRWDEVLSDTIVKWAWETLDKESEGCDCVDNYRVAAVRSSPQMRRYKRQKEHGCCGSRNFRRKGPDGQTYALGFNYGH